MRTLAGCGHFSPRAWPQNTAVHIQSFSCISPIFLFVVHDFILAQGDRVANSLVEQKSRFSEGGKSPECAPPKRFCAMRQLDLGPAAEISKVLAGHLWQFLGILRKHHRRGHRLAKTPLSEPYIRSGPFPFPSGTTYSTSCRPRRA